MRPLLPYLSHKNTLSSLAMCTTAYASHLKLQKGHDRHKKQHVKVGWGISVLVCSVGTLSSYLVWRGIKK